MHYYPELGEGFPPVIPTLLELNVPCAASVYYCIITSISGVYAYRQAKAKRQSSILVVVIA